ncbi:hypothetical protein JCM3766R1_001567 [Sporobolomyces carnicolor]
MTAPTTPRGPRQYGALDSTARSGVDAQQVPSLVPTRNPSTDGSFSTDEYDSNDESAALLRQSTTRKGSRLRESSAAAFLSNPLETPTSPQICQRQRRRRDRPDNDASSGPIAYIKGLTARYTVLTDLHAFLKIGLLLIALAQLFSSMMNLCVKVLVSEIDVPIWELIMIRMGFTALFCFLWLKSSGDPHPLLGPPGVRGLLCIRGIVGFLGLFPSYYVLQYLSLSDATTISFLSPVLVGVFAWILLREPYTQLEAVVGVTSLLGVVFIAKPSFLFPARPQHPDDLLNGVTPNQRTSAVIIALIGMCGAAGACLIIRVIGKRASAAHSILYFALYSVLAAPLYPLVFDSPPVLCLTTEFFAFLVLIGILGFGAQLLLTIGLQRERAGRGSLAIYTHLIFAMVLERIWYKTLPDAWSLLGAVVIIGGALGVALAKQVPNTASDQAAEIKAERGDSTRLDAEDDKHDEEGDPSDFTTTRGAGQARLGSGRANARGVDVRR